MFLIAEWRSHPSLALGGFDWSLTLLNAQESDEGLYECQVSTEPPLIRRMRLIVEGK